MVSRIFKEIMIPARSSIAFEVMRGQVLRIMEAEGPQVADLNAFSLKNFREHLQSAVSAQLNKSYRRFKTLYSNSPSLGIMFTVLEDPVGVHYLSGALGCTSKQYEEWFNIRGHPNCFDNLAKAISPWGLSHYDVHGPFDAFMNVTYSNGEMIILPPESKKGDFIDIRAEMDVLVAISACPSDTSDCNGKDRTPKSLKVQIHE